jgi:pyridoxal phosphate enzyme (YggS family)
MNTRFPGIATALEDVRRRIAGACGRSGRDPSTVALVAVSKTFPAERVREMLACGQTLFGENRVQEALQKIPLVGHGARWHLVGHLQRNKARHAVGAFELIHSVDDLELARELGHRAAAAARVQPILIEVNVAREASKAGADEGDLPALLDSVAGLAHLDLRGLMCIPPPVDDPERARGSFARLRELRDGATHRIGRPLPELSMGMSDDFEVAVEEGATLLRVGRALFGERPSQIQEP